MSGWGSSLESLNRFFKIVEYVFLGFSIRRVFLEIFDRSVTFYPPYIYIIHILRRHKEKIDHFLKILRPLVIVDHIQKLTLLYFDNRMIFPGFLVREVIKYVSLGVELLERVACLGSESTVE